MNSFTGFVPRWLLHGLLLATLPATAAERLPTVVQGEPPTATRLISVDPDWNLVVETANGRRLIPGRALVYWGAYRDPRRGALIVLADGSLLVGELTRAEQDRLHIISRTVGPLSLPQSAVRGVIFTLPSSLAEQDRLLGWMLGEQVEFDRLLLINGDRLAGRITISSAPDGQFELRVVPQHSGSELAIDLETATALTFRRTATELEVSGRQMEMGLRDGSLLAVKRIGATQQAGHVRLELNCGAELSAPARTLWRQLVWIQPTEFGQFAYLSDREPLAYRQIPFLDAGHSWRRDRNVLGGRLRVLGHRFSKGIGMAPASTLAFELTGQESEFRAELAVDDRAKGQGSVVFRVYLHKAGDGAVPPAWEPAYESPIIRGGQPPLPIAVDLRAASQLALLVEFSERGDELDYANWLNARVVLRP